jgi:membrane peptidoglycan carboxypeptidase
MQRNQYKQSKIYPIVVEVITFLVLVTIVGSPIASIFSNFIDLKKSEEAVKVAKSEQCQLIAMTDRDNRVIFDASRKNRRRGYQYFTNEAKLQFDKFAEQWAKVQSHKNCALVGQTTLNADLQKSAEMAMTGTINTYRPYGIAKGAVIVMDTETFEIRAMVGGEGEEYNLATTAKRSPASTFKVLTYIVALDRGISPKTQFSCYSAATVRDRRLVCSALKPGRYDMYDGLAYSDNAIAWKIANKVGEDKILILSEYLGLSFESNGGYGTIIGQDNVQVTLMELAKLYGAIANGGVLRNPQYFSTISDSRTCLSPIPYKNCENIYNFDPSRNVVDRAFSARTADKMNSLLQGVVHRPKATGNLAKSGAIAPDLAGKTGTNGVRNNARDLWFIGYSRQHKLLVAIWLGNDDRSFIKSEDLSKKIGGNLAAKTFRDVMQSAIYLKLKGNVRR